MGDETPGPKIKLWGSFARGRECVPEPGQGVALPVIVMLSIEDASGSHMEEGLMKTLKPCDQPGGMRSL